MIINYLKTSYLKHQKLALRSKVFFSLFYYVWICIFFSSKTKKKEYSSDEKESKKKSEKSEKRKEQEKRREERLKSKTEIKTEDTKSDATAPEATSEPVSDDKAVISTADVKPSSSSTGSPKKKTIDSIYKSLYSDESDNESKDTDVSDSIGKAIC